MWTQKDRSVWSEWRWRFAIIPSLAGQDEAGNKVWVWLRWYQRRSLYWGNHVEYRIPGITKSVTMDMTY